jgi:hypothetical protein
MLSCPTTTPPCEQGTSGVALGCGEERSVMPEPRQFIIIAKQREFDEVKWKQLLMAMAYLLHERRKAQAAGHSDKKADIHTKP